MLSSNSSIATLIAELKTKLSDRARDDLDRLISSPEAETLIARDEEQTLAARRELAARLKLVADGKHSQQRAAAGKRCETAARAVESAEIQLRAARENYVAATAGALAAETAEASERLDLERELRATADPRLEELAAHCEEISQLANTAFASRIIARRDWLTRQKITEVETNRGAVESARAALKMVAQDALRMQLLPIPSADVTERIHQHLQALEPKLDALHLNVLEIDADGRLKRDRTLSNRELTNAAIVQNGGVADAPNEVDRAPRINRARRVLATLQA